MENEGELAKTIVTKTADTMILAEQVLLELRRRDGQEFQVSDEKPSVLELVSVSQLIMSMTMNGMYKDPQKEDDMWPRIERLIEAKVDLRLIQRTMEASRVKAIPTAPLPRPEPPPRSGNP